MFYYDDDFNIVRVPPIKTIDSKQYYYDANSNVIIIDVIKKISSIYNSHEIYITKDNRCLKKFRFRGNPQSFELQQMIQSMNLDNFYTVDINLFDVSGNYRAILMPFYESSQEDILLKPTDYLTDNFNAIFSSFGRLADKQIRTNDANLENTIFLPNTVIIVDSDKYAMCPEYDKEYIKNENLGEASWILYQALEQAALKHPELCTNDFTEWFKKEEPNEMCRKLTKYKYPIDYLRSQR